MSGTAAPGVRLFFRHELDELPAEAAFDAEVAIGDVVVCGRGDLYDAVFLDVELESAADAAVGTDCIGLGLARLVPRPGVPHVALALEHQSAGGADADAVPAIDAGRVGQRRRELCRDTGVEAAAGYGDREGVL